MAGKPRKRGPDLPVIAKTAPLSYTIKFALRCFAKNENEYAGMLEILQEERPAREVERARGFGADTLRQKVDRFKETAQIAAIDLRGEMQLPTPGPTREGWEGDPEW